MSKGRKRLKDAPGVLVSKDNLLPDFNPQLSLFFADFIAPALKAERVSMEFPLFVVGKPRHTTKELTIRQRKKTYHIKIIPEGEKGSATQADKDVLLFLGAQIRKQRDDEESAGIKLSDTGVSRLVRFYPQQLFEYCNWNSDGGQAYQRLQDALDRLVGTRYKTNIEFIAPETEEEEDIDGAFFNFAVITKYAFLKYKGNKRASFVDVELSLEIFNALMDPNRILNLNKDYFRLPTQVDKALYELCKKFCGTQESWTCGVDKFFLYLGYDLNHPDKKERGTARTFKSRLLKDIAAGTRGYKCVLEYCLYYQEQEQEDVDGKKKVVGKFVVKPRILADPESIDLED